MPGKEVVTATRTDGAGRKIADAIIDHSLYVANTKSSGKDYQAQYGGEFLAELKAKYPEMFKVNIISTGKPIDDSVKLKQWKAEYFNEQTFLNVVLAMYLAMKQLVNTSQSLKMVTSFLFN